MRKTWLALAALAVAGTAVATALAGNSVTLTDPSGDNKAGPDSLGLLVRASKGQEIVDYALDRQTEKGEYLVVFIDADNNAKTGGNGSGADFLIEYEQADHGLLRVDKYNPKTKKLEFVKSFNSSFKRLWGQLPAPGSTYRFYFTPSMFGIKKGQTFGIYARAESAGESYTFDRIPNTGTAHITAP